MGEFSHRDLTAPVADKYSLVLNSSYLSRRTVSRYTHWKSLQRKMHAKEVNEYKLGLSALQMLRCVAPGLSGYNLHAPPVQKINETLDGTFV